MPKSPLNKQQVDQIGRTVAGAITTTASALAKAVAALAKAVAAVARYIARVATQIWRAFEAVPAALQLMFAVAILMLAGIVGTIALSGTAGVMCAVVLVPVTAITLGALGQRWYAGTRVAPARGIENPADESSDLARSVLYVDKKLTLALSSLGTNRHQQAVIALFQAKTAVDLALGTEQDEDEPANAPVHVEAYRLRPRIQAGAVAKSTLPESNSLAAS